MWQLSNSWPNIIFKTTWLDPIPTLLESVCILGWNTIKLLTVVQKTLHSLGSCTENLPLIKISSILSVNFTSLWHKCQRVFWWASCTSARHAGNFDCLMTSLILIDNGQWQRALCMLAVLQSSLPNPQRNWKNRICQVHLGFGLSASAQVPDKPALAWVACPGILHRS